LIPPWLKPLPIQLEQSHASWIDRVPWPDARAYLVKHPTITYDDFAAVYSSSFDISWPYDDSFVLVSESGLEDVGLTRRNQSISPVFEQHLGRLRYWTVGEKFRRKFPELYCIIEQDCVADSQFYNKVL